MRSRNSLLKDIQELWR